MFRYTLLDIRRTILSGSTLFYSVALPVIFYLLFGAMQPYSDYTVADGNAAAYVMIGMALYGAVNNTAAISAQTVNEISAGWGRQLALTPMSTTMFLAAKTILALVMCALPVVAVNITGSFTGVKIPLDQQVFSGVLTVLCGMVFSFLGIAMSLLIRSESAISITSGILVMLGFIGTIFTPLTSDLMSYARFTPIYGAAEIARYPFTRGLTIISGGSPTNWSMNEPLWYAVVNIAAWGVIFVTAAALLMRRSTRR